MDNASDDGDNPLNNSLRSQTSTTKALLVFIHVPKILRVHINKYDENKKGIERKESKGEPSSSNKTTNAAKSKPGNRNSHRKTESFASTRNEKPMVPTDNISSSRTVPSDNFSSTTPSGSSEKSAKESRDIGHNIGYVEAAEDDANFLENILPMKRKKQPVIEHVITAEEMAAVVKLEDDETEENILSDAPTKNPKPEEVNALTTAAKTFFGIVTNKEDKVMDHFSLGETIRILKSQTFNSTFPTDDTPVTVPTEDPNKPAPNTEIKVQALLQLTCKNLYKEGCFFTAPATINITKGEHADNWIQFTIMCKPNAIDLVLERLERIGIGSSVGMISIYKSELMKTADWPKLTDNEDNSGKKNQEQKLSMKRSGRSSDIVVTMEEAKQEWKNAASRMRVEQIKEQIHEQAALSFDFLALLFIASILAGIGLITDSTVVIVASMLVSPIMGPVMGMTFGSRVLDWKLARASAAAEVSALLIAVLVGGVVGLAGAFTEFAEHWPTEEMSSRGDVVGLITGIAIAIPSGMGVALSILGNNTSSLVGVAISASLLPPAVNAGICWAHAILIRAGAISNDEDLVLVGAISFALTLVNIVCIWIFGIITFTIKEVAPSKKKSAFWARDIKVARATQRSGSIRKEVDLETIKAGLQDALKRKHDEKGNVDTIRKKYLRRWRRRRKAADFSFCIADDNDEEDEEDFLEYFMLGLNPIVEETQGVDPKDRAAYLGFRSSIEDFAVEEVEGETRGWMSFFGRLKNE